MHKGRRRWWWLSAGALVLGLVLFHLSRSPEWRGFEWGRFESSLVNARPGFLLVALAANYSSYLLRAYRWKCFLDPIKKASLGVLFAGQVLGFSSIYLIGRPGEFVRPAYIARKENVAITSMVAVWLLERIYDAVFLVFLFAAALYFVPLDPSTARGKSIMATMHRGGAGMLVLAAVSIGALMALRFRAEKLRVRALGAFGFLPAWALGRFERVLSTFIDGLSVIRSGRDFLASVLSTVVLWTVNASVFWLVFQSLGGGLERLSWLAAVVVMCFAGLGLAVQFPGIGGGFQVGIILALTAVYNIQPEAATSAAILAWIMISISCVALGVGVLAYEGLTFSKLKAITEEERTATVERF